MKSERRREALNALKNVKDQYWQNIEEIGKRGETKERLTIFDHVTDFYRHSAEPLGQRLADRSPDLNYVTKYARGLDEALNCIDHLRDGFDELQSTFENLSQRTSSLYNACNELSGEEAALIFAAEQACSRLTYFDACDRIEHKLKSPMLSVASESFMHLIAIIDEGIAFFSAHAEYKDAKEYTDRYAKCLESALQFVRGYVTRILRNATQNVLARMTSEAAEDSFTQMYCIFAANAGQVRAVVKEMELRQHKNAHYAQLVADCYDIYFDQRELLVRPSFGRSVGALLADQKKTCCWLIRTGGSMLLRLCDDEECLFNQFFMAGRGPFDAFIMKFAQSFADAVRPRVIQLQHFEMLVELSTLLRMHLLDQRCYASEQNAYGGLAVVLEQILGDVTERLLYRAQLYAKSDIGDYKPATGDLAYPEKLDLIRKIAVEDGLDTQGLLYPTVQRTVNCLSKLSMCLEATSFQGIANDVITFCIESLMKAHALIKISKGLDNANLFLLKHLLVLRAQIAPLVGEGFSEATVDFAKVRDSAFNLISQKGRWFSIGSDNAFLQFLIKTPMETAESVVIDSRRNLDVIVKKTCQQFISQSVERFTSDLIKLQQRNQEEERLDAKAVGDVVLQVYRKIKTELPQFRTLMSLYFCNDETEKILFAPIKNEIKNRCGSFEKWTNGRFEEEERKLIAFPSEEALALLLNL